MADKIIRVFFRFAEDHFCIDRPYNLEQDDQQNCDAALQTLVESMHKGTIAPALRLLDKVHHHGGPEADHQTQSEHIFINLGVLPFIVIDNVMVYEVQDKPGPKAVK
jgi:hypothetical protein